MKVLICDHADCMMPDHALEIETLRAGLGEDVEVEVLEYEDDKRDEFYEHVADADALLTAFVTVDAEAMDRAPKLKVVSLNSTGVRQVDLDEATKRGIGVCPVGEYCTWDVAESAIAYMGALNKHFKFYQREIDERHKWITPRAPVAASGGSGAGHRRGIRLRQEHDGAVHLEAGFFSPCLYYWGEILYDGRDLLKLDKKEMRKIRGKQDFHDFPGTYDIS